MFQIGDLLCRLVHPAVYVIAIILINTAFALFAYQRRSLNPSGAVGTFITGAVIFLFFGFGGWVVLIVFFVTSSVLTHVARPWAKKVADGIQKKGGERDYMQVIANGGPSTLSALLYGLTGNEIFLLIFGTSMAASNSDTWAGEIGITSNKPPVLITNPTKVVPPGLSGGVTFLGTAGGFAGSLVIALTWYFAFNGIYSRSDLWTVASITIAGFAGCIVDSVLGATLQAHYWDTERNQLTEHEVRNGKKFELARGIKFLDNDMVNLTSNFAAIALVWVLAA
jgi:uncharacterized protein (TIGR00297 family)